MVRSQRPLLTLYSPAMEGLGFIITPEAGKCKGEIVGSY
jgi:hypothetical protein